MLHIPIKKEKKRGGEKDDNQKPKAIPNRKKYSPKRWVVYGKNQFMAQQVSGNYLPAMRKSQKTILDWYSSLVVSLSIER